MKAVGGYFELELNGKEGHYHATALKLNNGRNALFCILSHKPWSRIYLPDYFCDVLLQPIQKLDLEISYYKLDENFEPLIDFREIKEDALFLYTNYFGLKDLTVKALAEELPNLVVDNALSFFSKPLPRVLTFYSARKFFGVPDGAYLYADGINIDDLPVDISFHRCSHLLKRLELSPEEGYEDYLTNELLMDSAPVAKMSVLTDSLLSSINYKQVIDKRIQHYKFLSAHLDTVNLLKLKLEEDAVPMAYPFLTNDVLLREKLIANRIFIPRYWPHLLEATDKDSIAYRYAKFLLPLPVDHRMDFPALERMINLIK